jgi:hypothetical protein
VGLIYWLLVLAGCADGETEKVAAKVTPTAPQTGLVRFVALGDAGTGEDGQYAVAEAIGQVCEDRGCDFALYLGDNIYNTGVDSVSDPQFQDKFEAPYAALDFPFYATLGNHDYGGGGLGNEPDRPDPQVAYTERSDKWTLPDRTYSVDQHHVRLMSLDTNAILWGAIWEETEPQRAWLEEALGTDHRWKIAFGHHPYISNGEHGTAGRYSGIEGLPIISGQEIKDFFDASVCGQVDLYFAGHDHDLQWLESTCGTHFIVSGAGAKTRSLGEGEQPTRFEVGDTLGFLWVEIADDTLTGVFFDSDGAVLYQDTITKD